MGEVERLGAGLRGQDDCVQVGQPAWHAVQVSTTTAPRRERRIPVVLTREEAKNLVTYLKRIRNSTDSGGSDRRDDGATIESEYLG